MDTVTAKASINNMQPCFYWRSNPGDSLWSHVKVETQYSSFYPEPCSCACQAGARSPGHTSTGTPPLCWYSPGCSSLLQHTRPHLEQTTEAEAKGGGTVRCWRQTPAGLTMNSRHIVSRGGWRWKTLRNTSTSNFLLHPKTELLLLTF